MKSCNTAERLKQIMEERNLRQIDIIEKCRPFCKELGVKMGRSDFSQYLSGKIQPKQTKLAILSRALNVSEAWLMGFDVPMSAKDASTAETVDEREQVLLELFRLVPDGQKDEVINLIRSALKMEGLSK